MKIKTLAEYTGYNEKTLQTYIQKFEEIKLLKINSTRIKGEKGYFNRNTYHIFKPTNNYFRIEYDFIFNDLNFSKKEHSNIKGYLLLFKYICYGGSNTTLYSLNYIGEKGFLQIGLSTIKTLNRRAVSLKLISENENTDGYTINSPFIYEDNASVKIPNKALYGNYYKEIVSFCLSGNIIPPYYGEELMRIISFNYSVSSIFIDKLKERKLNSQEIASLNYFIKVLNMKVPQKNVKEEVTIML